MTGHLGPEDMRRRAADRAEARTEVLDGLGHWWMLQDPPALRTSSQTAGNRSAETSHHWRQPSADWLAH